MSKTHYSLGFGKIGEVVKATGLTTKTIRYCEEVELLPEPERTPTGQRPRLHQLT